MSATNAGAPSAQDTLTLLVGAQRLTGWQAVRVTRGVERMPADFDIMLTERYPGAGAGDPGLHAGEGAAQIVTKPGDPCRIDIGGDLVLTGYVDRYIPSIGVGEHSVRVLGRGRCQDIVDCSAVIAGMQITTDSLLDLATALAKPYGVTVRSLTGGDVPLTVPGGGPVQFSVTIGETVFEIIERVPRYATVLAYEDTDGSLLFANVGTQRMASGFVQGANVQAASVEFSMDGRYSQYLPAIMSTDSLHDIGTGGATPFPPVLDHGVPRFRQMIVVSEQWQYGHSIAQARAQWEMTRRFGRSQTVRVVADSWRDGSGNLWRPNALATVHLPALKIVNQQWVIAAVSFIRDPDRGTVAELELMPPQGLAVMPAVLQLYYPDIGRELAAGAASGGDPRPDAAPALRRPGGAQ